MSEKAANEAVGTSADDQQDVQIALSSSPDFDSEEIPDSFTCCVCLDLLYKPVLLSCGHMSCFWCVHKSMSGLRESKCPICRHPYIHFPSICPMLHFLLLKMYPSTYMKREKQTREEETKIQISSPQLDAQLWGSLRNECLSDGNSSLSSPTNQDSNVVHSSNVDYLPSTSSILVASKGTAHVDVFTYPHVLTEGSQSQYLPENELTKCQNKISITDVLCGSCKQLLFHPVALNCGHVFCKCCVLDSVPEKFECPVCQSRHPGGCPKVCLALDQFLEEEFPNDYALRKSTYQPNKISPGNQSPETVTGNGETDDATKDPTWGTDPLKTHFGVGCDYCGMYPIVGDRYQCQDCEELIGFDLCGDCYNSRCKLPGRFNQQHKPEHKFKYIRPNVMQRWMTRFLSGQLPQGTSAEAVLSFENAENVLASHAPNDDDNEYTMHIGYAVMEDDEEGEEEGEEEGGEEGESPSG